MCFDLTRRNFIGAGLAATTAGAGRQVWAAAPDPAEAKKAPPAAKSKLKQAPPEAAKLTAYQVGPQIWIRWANQLLTSYRAHPTQKYPYLYPVAGPLTGLSLTTESSLPYPHHRSLLFACDHVNAGNYWQGGVESGQIVSTGPRLGVCTPESAEILDECEWRQPGQPVVLRDQRKITVSVPAENVRFIDAEIVWTAVQDVTIGKTNHSLFSVRAAVDITPFGGGTLLNSNGEQGETETFGKQAHWCSYYGKRYGGAVEGIALFDHPANLSQDGFRGLPRPDGAEAPGVDDPVAKASSQHDPWSPSPWFTRDYGFISPTPFNFIQQPWELAAGRSVSMRWRVVLYAGEPADVGLDSLFRQWAV